MLPLPTCLPASPPSQPPPRQFLVAEAAQRVFLVADGGVRLLEGGVAEYVSQLTGKGKKKAAPAGGTAGGKAAPAGGKPGSSGSGGAKRK